MLINFLTREASKLLARLTSGNPPGLPQVERRQGSWHHADLEWMAHHVRSVPGDFAEIGVFRGDAFRKVAMLAAAQGRLAHAFDSFVGMDEPGAEDGIRYPKGKFDVGGPEQFARLMDGAGVPRAYYRMWPGYVPACFEAAPPALRFSFAILDLDHYRPTVDALNWLAPRISAGGLLALDDYPAWPDELATKAIQEFLAGDTDFEKVAFFNHQLILRKLPPRA